MALTTNVSQSNFDSHVRQTSIAKDADQNILDSTTGSVFTIKLVNAAVISYFKLYDAYAPTYGTTAPELVVPVAANTTMVVTCRQGIVFGTACSAAASKASGTGHSVDAVPTSLAYTIFGGP
tara:strand:+ start:337 stop:702 length:366 start_codon:yes stop_codon:yes gene_type:complete